MITHRKSLLAWINRLATASLTVAAWIALPATQAIPRADALADTLKLHVGETIDLIELGSGKRFVRPTLVGVTHNGDDVSALRLKAEGETKSISILLAGIVKIIARRETIYESTVQKVSAMHLRSQRTKELYEKQRAESVQRMRVHHIEPWPLLTAEQQAAHVAALEAFVGEVRQAFPSLQVSNTHEFLVATDIPAAQMAPYVASLDAMHDFLCDLYGIPRGEPVWKGKCLVLAFLKEEDFTAFEHRFMQTQMKGAHGICHQTSDGRVVMACHRGDDPSTFAHMLVHETSHGFNHRWMSPTHLPNWLNEGIAEWAGTHVVPACRQVPLKEARALEFMRARGTTGPGFFDNGPNAHIEAGQYGIASSMVKFLVARNRKKFAEFVQGVKEGTSVEESLQQTFKASLDEVLKAYGKSIGLPGLRRDPQ
ncbi:MAG: hypothetical protein DWI25_07360 [Planctomycetota bacterium]|nr:MAG: hypothetical protein DWI25_07360 [Planctomycetota bacterium]